MKAIELIGKNAVRTQPIYELVDSGLFGMGLTKKPDYSYTTKPAKILKATETHIVIEITLYDGSTKQELLNSKFCDENWIDYDELVRIEEPEPIQE